MIAKLTIDTLGCAPIIDQPDRPSQNATAQSVAWEARQAIPEGISLDRLSQSALQECTR